MADYKRIVSYIYQYNQQVKDNNIGFTRIETRNGQCKIIVHVRVPNIQDVTMNVYAYCWYDGMIHAISLGSMTISKGIGEFKILTDANDLCHSQYRLADMGGILVYLSDALYLGTEWDDHPIQFEYLHIDEEKPENFEKRRIRRGESLSSASQTERSSNIPSESVTSMPVIEDIVEEQVLLHAAGSGPVDLEVASAEQTTESKESEEVTLPEEQATDVTIEDESITVVEDGVDSALEEEQQSLSKQRMEQLDKRAKELFGSILSNAAFAPQREEEDPDTSVVVDPKAAISFFTTFKSCESKQEYEEVQQEIEQLYTRIGQLERVCREWKIKEARIKEHEQARREAEQERLSQEEELRKNFDLQAADDMNSQLSDQKERGNPDSYIDEDEETEIPPVVQRILGRYPTIEPFVDLEEGDCVRIEPQDIGIFPMENWILANNSFLLHGYYSYRHLIFFYKKVYNKVVYMLGVPGVNHSRERFMANMFGFAMFHPLTKVAEQDSMQAASNSMSGNPAYDEVAGGEFGYWCMEIRF